MNKVLNHILKAKSNGDKLLAILVDPDKFKASNAPAFVRSLPVKTTHLFVGGSTVDKGVTQNLVEAFKLCTALPIVLFPGDYSQLSPAADAVLYLSLLSGTNAEYLVGQQLKAVPFLKENALEVIPTGYILIDGGSHSAVAKVTGTQAIAQSQEEHILELVQMAQYLGKHCVYLEAGSGATTPVNGTIIEKASKVLNIPLIVGGGIKTGQQLALAYKSGADMVVMGTAFEQ